jgi:hypothetical protein
MGLEEWTSGQRFEVIFWGRKENPKAKRSGKGIEEIKKSGNKEIGNPEQESQK